jgi:NAD(P)H-dependent FMN reductase
MAATSHSGSASEVLLLNVVAAATSAGAAVRVVHLRDLHLPLYDVDPIAVDEGVDRSAAAAAAAATGPQGTSPTSCAAPVASRVPSHTEVIRPPDAVKVPHHEKEGHQRHRFETFDPHQASIESVASSYTPHGGVSSAAAVGAPSGARRLRDLFAAADGLLLALPDCGGLPPPILVNALAWLTHVQSEGALRCGCGSTAGKVVALMSVGPAAAAAAPIDAFHQHSVEHPISGAAAAAMGKPDRAEGARAMRRQVREMLEAQFGMVVLTEFVDLTVVGARSTARPDSSVEQADAPLLPTFEPETGVLESEEHRSAVVALAAAIVHAASDLKMAQQGPAARLRHGDGDGEVEVVVA